MDFYVITIKQGIILFSAMWLSLVLLLNFLDVAKNLKLLPETWKFASGNFLFMQSVTKIFHTPNPLTWFMYISAIVWEVVAVYLLWAALGAFDPRNLRLVNLAFMVNLALWAAFMFMDELFLAWSVPGFNIAETHRSLFTANLVSLMAIHLLPNA
ncbi:MAG: hypothetical protein ACK41E_08100 [Deinococcales bacterium]